MHEKMKLLFAKGKRPEYFELNQKIHDALVEMSGNESLMMIHSMLSKRMRSLRYSGNSTPDNWRGALEDHEEIASALGKRDMKAIKKAVNDHFTNTIKRYQANAARDELVASIQVAQTEARRRGRMVFLSRHTNAANQGVTFLLGGFLPKPFAIEVNNAR
jgi:hypothetical protein